MGIEDCKALCDARDDCVAFMYGGATWETNPFFSDMTACEISAFREPNGSWGDNYIFCASIIQLECPVGYEQVGTLSSNNDIAGAALGQSTQATIEACKALCDSRDDCVAFMYGGNSELVGHPFFSDMTLCEIAASKEPNFSWGDNFIFCAETGYHFPEIDGGCWKLVRRVQSG